MIKIKDESLSIGAALVTLAVGGTAVVLTIAALKPSKAGTDCRKRHPYSLTKVIDGECFYKTQFGWIKTGKEVRAIKGRKFL